VAPPRAPLTEGEIEIGGIRSPLLAAAPQGAGRATEAALFVHGNPSSSEDWRGLVGAAGSVVRCAAFDMPGFGRAGKPRSFEATVEGYARHLGAALDTLGIARAHLVLHDFGGPWGLEWASRNAGRFASVVLVDTGVFTGFRWHRIARLWRTPVVGELVMLATTRSRLSAELAKSDPRVPKQELERMTRDFDAGTKRTVLALYRATDLDAMSGRQEAALAPLHRPALVIWGGRDRFLSKRVGEAQRAIFHVEELVVLPESGHWPMLDDPAPVEEAVVAFLARHVGHRA
jgi:pimeloyl-ACP methyl ester carboxylesterase